MKGTEELKPNFAPVYAAAMYPDLCKIFQQHGYALAAHGSLARDLDLVAIPWTPDPADPARVIKCLTTVFALTQIDPPNTRYHGRLVYTLSCGFGQCSIDLSFMPCR